MKRKGKAYLAGDCSGDERAQRDGHRATTTRYSLLLCVLFFSVWCVCPSLFFFFFCSFPLGFSQYTLCSLFLLPYVLFSFPSPSPLVCSPARFFFSLFRSTLPRSPCISLLQCPVPGAVAAKDGALELLLKTKYNGLTLCFPLLSFFLVLPPPLFSWLSLLSLRPFLSFVFFPQRPFSSFYKAREGHVSLPPETAGIVEARDRGLQKRHRGYSGRDLLDFPLAMICWIFPWPWSAGFSPVAPDFGKQMMNSRIQNGVIWHGKWQIVVWSLTFWNVSIGSLNH